MLMSLLKSLLFFLVICLGPVITLLCLWLDLHVFNNNLSEISLTEITQELTLFVIVFIHFYLAIKHDLFRYCNILVSGFFLAMLVRELDALFDLIAHGCWVWFALAVAITAIVGPVVKWRTTLTQLEQYTRTPYYGIMISGLVAILIFSRLFGMSMLWNVVLQEGYLRVVKNVVEEGSEMFGYMLCLAATTGYTCYVLKLQNKQR